MTENKPCPRCQSKHTEIEGDDLFTYLICLDCGFDESLEYEEADDKRTGKGTGGGSPYRRGGAIRSQKR